MTEKIIPTERLIPTLLYPVTGLVAGTPVLVRKLTAPQRERRAEAAALKAKRDEITTQAAEAAEAAFTQKLLAEADPVKRAAMLQAQEAAQVTARQVELEQAKAARKEQRSRLGDTAGAAALLLIVGGPLVWSLARPWIQPGIGVLLGAWWIAALIHAPAHGKDAPAEGQEDQDQPVPAVEEKPAEEDPVEAPQATVPTPVEAHSLTACLTASGSSVLLTRLAADLGAAHPSWTGSTKAVRALLSEAGVPVREGVRTPDGNGPGVHHQDVPPLPSPPETPAVANVGPGQSANANTNNAREWSTREGFVMQTDPDNPARTIIVGRTTAA
ncbi:hypothetical protein ACIPYS_19425 [Kitasatospora sp. NPDC089913]|uniref:hypothetical protein n=1 Tax=Kitasatospora sp. NPDC089913 TaxID=3364080 RepID=UPI0038251143